ncbi:hypothetical protein [Amycolatopsis sp. CA-230715]|uniref:hypothetical protein n=1 Tax=Amycolatopsis sp. CA-230715 TaxID=2745196 RepID=UPI001C019D9B|nr:hypothetical protein [Amycolatopsis sp. CA-230715]QWF79012.1 hypothetical protein HUW46_02413 [Amycolatopsis sp. CA-230715]
MTLARHGGHTQEIEHTGRMAGIKAEEAARLDQQHDRAMITVAGHAADAAECAELLAMLGLTGARGPHEAEIGS